MSDEPFLARWSRRKRDGEKAEPDDAPRAQEHAADIAQASPDDAVPAKDDRAREEKPAFDVTTLPPIESIEANTDITAFLAEGVPAALKRAALRRVWTADPAIRDFRGLQENDWDFTRPDSIPGFGELSPELDVQQMVRGVFGDPPPEAAREPQLASAPSAGGEIPTQPDDRSHVRTSGLTDVAHTEGNEEQNEKPPPSNAAQPEISPEELSSQEQPLLQRTPDDASQQEMTLSQRPPAKRHRSHGGALPRDFGESGSDS